MTENEDGWDKETDLANSNLAHWAVCRIAPGGELIFYSAEKALERIRLYRAGVPISYIDSETY